MSIALTIYPDNDCVLELKTKDVIDAISLADAAVTYDLRDSSNGPVDSGPMTYIESSNGYYIFRATLADTLVINVGGNYSVVVDSDGGAGRRGNWSLDVTAKKRD